MRSVLRDRGITGVLVLGVAAESALLPRLEAVAHAVYGVVSGLSLRRLGR